MKLDKHQTVEVYWSKDKTTTQVVGLKKLPKELKERILSELARELLSADITFYPKNFWKL